ncbi:MAG: hypothetical protein QM626_13615 [Microbacterium sp.]|uniref:hypothetical protein n=1 Tax=Microbacterium sp. TaxID=51671 RepID=UPI0039E28A37
MSTGGFPPPIPLGDDDTENPAIREEDGEEVLDEDVNDDLVDSAEADRIAAERENPE